MLFRSRSHLHQYQHERLEKMEVEEYTATVTMESAAIAWLEAGDTTAV